MLAFALALSFAVPPPATAQSLPAAACDTLQRLGAKFGSLNQGDDDQRRQFALIVAEQFAFSFPNQGWGSKSAGAGRPQTKDVVARQGMMGLEGWDLVDGATRQVTCTSHVDLQGQVFIAVAPRDHLGGSPPPPPPGPLPGPLPPPPPELLTATADLQQQQLALLLQIIAKLETQLDQQRVQSAALESAVRDLKAEIAKGIRVRF